MTDRNRLESENGVRPAEGLCVECNKSEASVGRWLCWSCAMRRPAGWQGSVHADAQRIEERRNRGGGQ